MKKLILTMAVLFLASTSYAEPLQVSNISDKIPETKHGIAYSFQDSEINYLNTFDVIEWKKFNLEAGYSSRDKIVAVASVDLIDFEGIIKFPVLEHLHFRPGIYVGFDRIVSGRAGTDAGISASFLEVKF